MITNISGFPEYLPEYQITFNKIINIIRNTFELYGFCPLDTPVVERTSTLLAKGNDNEIYGIYRLTDPNDKKDLALRFDLTVPLARYIVQHADELIFPYRRYHIAPVWRGERPQAGRYRQFYQCDIDIIDTQELPITNDAEILSVIYEILIQFGVDFEIKINNKKILNGFIHHLFGNDIDPNPVLRVIDKREKISHEKFCSQLLDLGISSEQLSQLLEFFEITGDNEYMINHLQSLCINNEFENGVNELHSLYNYLQNFGVPKKNISVDIRLARGLAYYTGNIFETKLRGMNFSSSISGGGRYDNLTSLFSNKKYPGVGVTLGITRLVPVLIENGIFTNNEKTPAKVLVSTQASDRLGDYISIASRLRDSGINTEIYLQNSKLGAQMNYANKKGFKFVIIANENELLSGNVNLKNLSTGEQKLINVISLVNELKEN